METNNFSSELRSIRIELEAIKSQIELTSSGLRDTFETELLQKKLNSEILRSITNLLTSIQEHKEPSTIFQKAMGFLNEMEQIEFISRNVMEALKRGESPSTISKRYQELGILEPTSADNQPEFKEELTKFWFNLNYKTLKSLGTLGARLASKCLKSIPELTKIKAHFSPLPPFISFSCEMQDSIDGLLEMVQDSIKETNIILEK
ncbi:MAG: hypothetical protein KIPDCIKN_02982 [Haliscomenobacter sp.]|jgi:hypothetical protein|nr:hypothetical protein [Haliscomenobacter sp.]